MGALILFQLQHIAGQELKAQVSNHVVVLVDTDLIKSFLQCYDILIKHELLLVVEICHSKYIDHIPQSKHFKTHAFVIKDFSSVSKWQFFISFKMAQAQLDAANFSLQSDQFQNIYCQFSKCKIICTLDENMYLILKRTKKDDSIILQKGKCV